MFFEGGNQGIKIKEISRPSEFNTLRISDFEVICSKGISSYVNCTLPITSFKLDPFFITATIRRNNLANKTDLKCEDKVMQRKIWHANCECCTNNIRHQTINQNNSDLASVVNCRFEILRQGENTDQAHQCHLSYFDSVYDVGEGTGLGHLQKSRQCFTNCEGNI